MTEPVALVWLDGALIPRDEARVSVDDFGLRYGLTCFETMLARHGRVFRLDAHLDRLEASLRLFRVEPPAREMLANALADTLAANALTDAAVRLSVTPGRGSRPALPASGPPSIVVTVNSVAAQASQGHLWVSEGIRLHTGRAWREAKVGQFAPYLLARLEAEEHEADDALLTNEHGNFVEASTANLFVERAGVLMTPPLADGPLPGITRSCVLEVAHTLGIEAREISLAVADVGTWNAAFLTSSVVGLAPIDSIVAPSAGSTTKWQPRSDSPLFVEISHAYESLVEAETS